MHNDIFLSKEELLAFLRLPNALHILSTTGNYDFLFQALNKTEYFREISSGEDIVFNLNSYDEKGFAPIHCAASQGHTKLVALLIKHGADINIVMNTSSSITSLGIAIEYFKLDTAAFLILQGANFNYVDNKGQTILHKLVILYKLKDDLVNKDFLKELIKFVIFKDPSLVNKQDSEGNTPLHHSALHPDTAIPEILIEYGASCYIKSNKNITPLNLFMLTKSVFAAKIITDQIHKIAEESYEEIHQKMLKLLEEKMKEKIDLIKKESETEDHFSGGAGEGSGAGGSYSSEDVDDVESESTEATELFPSQEQDRISTLKRSNAVVKVSGSEHQDPLSMEDSVVTSVMGEEAEKAFDSEV